MSGVINNYHAGYFMHFIPAQFDQKNYLQHFTLDAVWILITTADLDLHRFQNKTL